MKITLTRAVELSNGDAAADRAKWGVELFDKALAHHEKRGLVADIDAGTTRDRDGIRSQFTAYDWSDTYKADPGAIYFDFFRPAICNSCDRTRRGFTP